MYGTKTINLSTVLGSGLGPWLFAILVIDLMPSSSTNHIVKYADDTSLLVPEKFSIFLEDEFMHMQNWAKISNF